MAVALAGGACYALRPIAGKGSQVATSDKIFEFKVAEVLVDDFLGQGSDMILLISPAGRAALWDAGTDMIHGAFVKLKEHAWRRQRVLSRCFGQDDHVLTRRARDTP